MASSILGVAEDASTAEIRSAYRALIGSHHPDRAGAGSADRAAQINEAYRVLSVVDRPGASTSGPPGTTASEEPGPGSTSHGAPGPTDGSPVPLDAAPAVARIDADTLLVSAPADETFRWLIEAADDIGEITYLDRSSAILEILCRFEGEPATSLMATLQGRASGTEVFCTVESIEDRAAPPSEAVIDLFELAFRRRQSQTW